MIHLSVNPFFYFISKQLFAKKLILMIKLLYFSISLLTLVTNLEAQTHIRTNQIFVRSSNVIQTISGNFVNEQSQCILGGTTVFYANTEQKIEGNLIDFNYLIINNKNGVNILCPIEIGHKIVLQNGVVRIFDNDLVLRQNAKFSSVGSYGVNRMITTNGTGKIVYQLSKPDFLFFPVGDETGTSDFTPISLDVVSGIFNNGKIGLNLKNEKHLMLSATSNYMNRYFKISSSGISNPKTIVEAVFLESDKVGFSKNMYAGLYENNQWKMLKKLNDLILYDTLFTFGDLVAQEQKLFDIQSFTTTESPTKISIQNHILTVQFATIPNQIPRLVLYDLTGRLLWETTLNLSQKQEITLPLNLSSSVYLVYIHSSEIQNITKIFAGK